MAIPKGSGYPKYQKSQLGIGSVPVGDLPRRLASFPGGLPASRAARQLPGRLASFFDHVSSLSLPPHPNRGPLGFPGAPQTGRVRRFFGLATCPPVRPQRRDRYAGYRARVSQCVFNPGAPCPGSCSTGMEPPPSPPGREIETGSAGRWWLRVGRSSGISPFCAATPRLTTARGPILPCVTGRYCDSPLKTCALHPGKSPIRAAWFAIRSPLPFNGIPILVL